MEDYAPILWILFIVVSMGFSALSRARRRAARHAEASGEEQSRGGTSSHPTVPRYPTPGSGLPEGFPLPQRSNNRNGAAGRPRQTVPQPETAPMIPPQARQTDVPMRTTQSPWVQSATVYAEPSVQQQATTRHAPSNPAPEGHGLQHTGKSLQRKHSTVSATHPQVTPALHEKEPVRPSRREETANETASEFDLRKAVIYAEILKPKFEE